MNEIKVAIADDQSIFRQGLVNLVGGFKNVRVLFSAENGREMLEKIPDNKPDLVLLDFRMPELNGLETAKIIRDQFSGVRVLILSMYDDQEFVETAMENGAHGYLSKDDEPEEIERAILSTIETGYYLNDRTSKMLIGKLINQGTMKPEFKTPPVEFTTMELQILDLICSECTTQEIADKLCKSKRTIESSRTLMMQKINARNVVGLVMYAVKNNLVES
ncbi:MAG: response regulator transcription factor [Flavobacteriia bacterium]|nr:response regulator transcription factor [Flavobacteriia bacterium]